MKLNPFSKDRTRMLACIAAMFSIFWMLPCAHANSNAQELQHKTADIALLKIQLEDRKQQAGKVLEELGMVEDELVNEIRILIKSYNIASLDDALPHQRLTYNIKLMQQLLTYTQALEEKIRFYQLGKDKLTYLHQLVQDDLKMSATLSDFKIDALTTQISMLINKYLSEAHIIQIDRQPLDKVSARQVWNFIERQNQ